MYLQISDDEISSEVSLHLRFKGNLKVHFRLIHQQSSRILICPFSFCLGFLFLDLYIYFSDLNIPFIFFLTYIFTRKEQIQISETNPTWKSSGQIRVSKGVPRIQIYIQLQMTKTSSEQNSQEFKTYANTFVLI